MQIVWLVCVKFIDFVWKTSRAQKRTTIRYRIGSQGQSLIEMRIEAPNGGKSADEHDILINISFSFPTQWPAIMEIEEERENLRQILFQLIIRTKSI